jgi:hypothetical protein
MLERGEWRAEDPENDGKVRGYHLSALYSPLGWMSWGDIAAAFVAVHKNPLEFRVFTNTVLGETWRERGEAPEWKRLYERRESYGLGTVPRGGLVLTAGADVQKDRIVVEIVAWGRGKSSWSIDYGVIPGDTSLLPDPALELDPSPWKQLDELLARVFPHEDGAEMPIRMLAVDSGYNTQTVYSWCRKYPMNRVIAVKGQASGGILIGSPSPVDINMRGSGRSTATRSGRCAAPSRRASSTGGCGWRRRTTTSRSRRGSATSLNTTTTTSSSSPPSTWSRARRSADSWPWNGSSSPGARTTSSTAASTRARPRRWSASIAGRRWTGRRTSAPSPGMRRRRRRRGRAVAGSAGGRGEAARNGGQDHPEGRGRRREEGLAAGTGAIARSLVPRRRTKAEIN